MRCTLPAILRIQEKEYRICPINPRISRMRRRRCRSTWMACDAEDSGFQNLNDDEIVTYLQEESDPVDDEKDEEEDNNNNNESRR
ncbi:hypothetical protein TNCV_1126431 [Trichonephila clavipes]|nr:hypothetical protein TNCV_1126431 [Trichonephila clavipes]